MRLTVAQALVTYLSRQYSVADGNRRRLIPAALGIFGHGNVAGWAKHWISSATRCRSSRAGMSRRWSTWRPATPKRRDGATLAVTASIGPGL